MFLNVVNFFLCILTNLIVVPIFIFVHQIFNLKAIKKNILVFNFFEIQSIKSLKYF